MRLFVCRPTVNHLPQKWPLMCGDAPFVTPSKTNTSSDWLLTFKRIPSLPTPIFQASPYHSDMDDTKIQVPEEEKKTNSCIVCYMVFFWAVIATVFIVTLVFAILMALNFF